MERALKDLDGSEPETALVQERTWQLLSRLVVLMPRLESPDETDWVALENRLIAVARDSDQAGASRLRDRLVVLASEYPSKAARVDIAMLRRNAHEVLDSNARRHQEAWGALDRLHDVALKSVRGEIATFDGARSMSLDRSDAATELAVAAAGNAAVIVSGHSGVGKSALTLLSLAAKCEADPATGQALCMNLRHVPKLPADFENILGCPLSTLLCELSAPHRMLIVDGADAVTEGWEDTFRHLVDAAVEGQVKVVAVTSIDSLQVVRDILAVHFGAGVAEHTVKPLTDFELDDIVTTFAELERLNRNPRSRELLRRLVVVDLLVRSHLSGVPLSDADAMRKVWFGLVRRQGRSDRGNPHAREVVLLRLAALSLRGGERLDVISGLDATAISGLQQDGLLQPSLENHFMISPDFSHDEVRRYAIARLLLAERDPTSVIMSAGAPRWALGATRLACQALLDEPDTAATPLRGRFAALQASFDTFVEAGHGTRWGDVPIEALVTLADPSAVLKDAWPDLRASDAAGLRRLVRIVSQRLRENGIVNPIAIEPIIELLLEDNTPWRSGDYASDLLREWLHGHASAGTPAGHPLRIVLREHLVEACATADIRLAEQRETEAAARAARTPEEIERERQFAESHPEIFSEILYGVRRRRQRPEVPHECRDEIFLELLALLGPDLGDDGEAILRRIAQDAPWSLAPAVEEPLTGVALASYRRGLLARVAEAYYLDDEAHDAGLDRGVRGHRTRMGSLYLPHYAWYRGPFMSLFQIDFRGGVALLNRLLNHAALTRARTLARLDQSDHVPEDLNVGSYQADLKITGTRRLYVGDDHVWMWYRGTGVGPYPCISALQALERTCDQLIEDGVPTKTLVPVLLEGCENLAMLGLVVGVLVRHLEVAGNSLDPYLTEPLIWSLEFKRVANEHGPLATDSEGIKASERRKWSLREAAMAMTLGAGDERLRELRALGESLVGGARRRMEQVDEADATQKEANGDEDIELQFAAVKAWASNLDREKFQVHEAPDGLRIQAMPPEEVVQALQQSNEDLQRAAEEIRLTGRYFVKSNEAYAEGLEPDELKADIAFVRELIENPPSRSASRPWDVPALVSAAAIKAHLLRSVDLPDDTLTFAVDTVLRVAEGEAPPSPYEFEDTYFEQGADRSAARVLPLLLMPAAASLRANLDGAGGWETLKRVSAAGLNIAQAVAYEVRLHLARGLDHLWAAPCVRDGACHHEEGWQIAAETMRACAVGNWNPDTGMYSVIVLDEPLAESLSNIADDSILPSRLDAPIRALAPAATANICVSSSARDLLTALLAAERRSLLRREDNDMDRRGTHSLVSARALLTLAQHGDDAALYEHINVYAGNSALLGTFLSAVSAAGEETPARAEAVGRIWPSVIRHVLDLHNHGQVQFRGDLHGQMTLASLIPNATYEYRYLYRELQGQPIVWWAPLAMRSEVELWLAPAVGKARCVDQVIGFLRTLAPEDQACMGLPWVATLVLASPGQIAKGSLMLAEWLIETRSAAIATDLSGSWQQIVDALVVEGVSRLAPYSE